MSEYQYYEFVSIDQPLTPVQMAGLRACSSRASITPTSFVNEYHWGGLKADQDDWMRRYFDAHVYVTDRCVCCFMVRVPRETFDSATLNAFATESSIYIGSSESHWIISWNLNESENHDRFCEDDGRGWMGRLVALRDELLRGDLRSLYLGWLAGVTIGEVEEPNNVSSSRQNSKPNVMRICAHWLRTLIAAGRCWIRKRNEVLHRPMTRLAGL